MGSHLDASTRRYGPVMMIFLAVLWLIIGPLLVAAGALMLMVIAMMIGFSVVLLTLWLTVIHWAFGQDWIANFSAFVKFVNEVIEIVGKARR
jgi:hypothetical protein